MLSSPEIVLVTIIAIFTALLAVIYLDRGPGSQLRNDAETAEPLALLFDDGVLHHATTTALRRFSLMPGVHLWDDLRETLKDRFPELPVCQGTGERGSLSFQANDTDSFQTVEMSWRGSLCWVTCLDQPGHLDGTDNDRFAALQRISETAPHPAWQMDANGRVTWYNRSYRDLFHHIHDRRPQPNDSLFQNAMDPPSSRVSLETGTGGTPDWYEISTDEADGVTIHHATSITALVRAEEAQRTFVQTLAKTFAHLPIGLAIFNRNEQLVLFNPALLELSGLSAEFLSARPNMLSFFDQLRENRRMPEPKNYRNWRQEIADLVSAAADGRYRETWSLEDGRTYSVQGRPHPDGATVFLFEDISAEISLTRNFRAELELSQYLLDKVDDGIVVFSPSGVLTFCNLAYRHLWQQNPDAAFADITLADCVDIWRRKAKADLPWQDILKVTGAYRKRPSMATTITLNDGQLMSCEAESTSSGATLIRFRNLQGAAVGIL